MFLYHTRRIRTKHLLQIACGKRKRKVIVNCLLSIYISEGIYEVNSISITTFVLVGRQKRIIRKGKREGKGKGKGKRTKVVIVIKQMVVLLCSPN